MGDEAILFLPKGRFGFFFMETCVEEPLAPKVNVTLSQVNPYYRDYTAMLKEEEEEEEEEEKE